MTRWDAVLSRVKHVCTYVINRVKHLCAAFSWSPSRCGTSRTTSAIWTPPSTPSAMPSAMRPSGNPHAWASLFHNNYIHICTMGEEHNRRLNVQGSNPETVGRRRQIPAPIFYNLKQILAKLYVNLVAL